MILATEDAVSEAVARRLVSDLRPELTIDVCLPTSGRGYLEKKASSLNQTARNIPVLILMDLDRPEPCPPALIARSIQSAPARNLLFRVAVMEIEAWVMADREDFAEFLGIPAHRIPENVDDVPHPKELVVNLARKSRRREIRDDLVPLPGGTASVGPAFNARLVHYVVSRWDCHRAAEASPSLRRAIDRLRAAFR